jgi:hypothetical protein
LNPQFNSALALAMMLILSPVEALSPRVMPRGDNDPAAKTIPSPHTTMRSQVGRLADVRIVDRSTGAGLPIYEHLGEYWVLGTSGNKYAISFQHKSTEARTLAVTSVDGINVISGQIAAYLQTGYVLSGMGSFEINGWRKSLQEVAAFTFAAPGESYATKTGRAANIGVIGVALFVEQPERVLMQRPQNDQPGSSNSPSAAATPSPSQALGSSGGAAAESKRSADLTDSPQRSLSPGLGTQHGQREISVTQNVAFKRSSTTPSEVIMIRYDSAENLVRRGVLAYAQPVPLNPPTAMAFPDSVGFVADPPRR